MNTQNRPADDNWYRPVERPMRYPLELTEDLHICLWSEDDKFKWSIAHWVREKEGCDLRFVGNRPLDKRVNWQHFRELVEQGQGIADRQFRDADE